MRKCSECNENVAMLYIQDMNDRTKVRGLCLSCAKKLNVPGIDEILEKAGIDHENIDEITEQMNSASEMFEQQMRNIDPLSMKEVFNSISTNEDFVNIGKSLSNLFANSKEDKNKDDKDDEKKTVIIDEIKEDKKEKNDEDAKKDDGLIDMGTFEQELRDMIGNLGSGASVFGIGMGDQGPVFEDMTKFYEDKDLKEKHNKYQNSKDRKRNMKTIDKFGNNLTRLAQDDKIDPVIGRQKEIDRTIQILNRRTKNNPVLLGEPGVGKTAIAEGLALKIVKGEVPQKLLGYEVIQLDMASIVAGTQFRGQFETRLKNIIDEAKKNGKVILVIDELHSIMGAGDSQGGGLDAANILKPALAKGEIQVIGATTLNEYKKTIEKDKALERRFQSVIVEEPTVEETIEIIKGLKDYYEKYHKIILSDEVIRDAVKLSNRYITDRFLPDKAIDVIDEAGSKTNLKNTYIHEIESIKESIETTRQKQMEASDMQDYEKAANYKTQEAKLQENLKELEEKEYISVTTKDIADVIEDWTKIPVKELTVEESIKLMNLEKNLQKSVMGQDEAISTVSKSIRRNRAGISPVKKPSSFIFVGPTGVGKTQLVKSLAKEMFGSEDMIIRIDMSEYMEKHSVSKFIGSPPGYVGFDEGGQLTDKVRRKPYSIILLDEIEKAHPDVFNMLLQILDDGRLTDSQGRVVRFENTIVIMTSNIGTTFKNKSLGFGSSENVKEKSRVQEALKETFKPEFLNRVDDIVVFNNLDRENLRKIVDIMFNQLSDMIKDKGINIKITDEVKDFILEKGYDEKYGARPLRRTIQKYIEDEIADLFIMQDISKYNMLTLKMLEKQVMIEKA